VNSQGGTPKLDNGDLVSSFNQDHFNRLAQYQLSQWVDVESTRFVNYFTVAATGSKWLLAGKAAVSPGNYQVVMQNNYLTKGQFTKELVITEVGLLGATNHVLGFTVFAYGTPPFIQDSSSSSSTSTSASSGASEPLHDFCHSMGLMWMVCVVCVARVVGFINLCDHR
jgi:hypothetical protein